MNYKTKATLQGFLVVFLSVLVAMLVAMAYDIGIKQGQLTEQSRCGVSIHCAPIYKVENIEAAKYRRIKNCSVLLTKWENDR